MPPPRRLHDAEQLFGECFGRPPQLGARAPGRVNLIGEHTDYNGGLVLPCAIDLETVVLLAPRDDGRVRLVSAGADGSADEGPASPDSQPSSPEPSPAVLESSLALLDWERAPAQATGGWGDYVAGVVWALAERGIEAPGFDLAVASDVPLGAGLSSSAALQVAVATALDALVGAGLSPLDRARLAQRSENGFVGVRCGVLDPFACALCEPGAALRIDCRDETMRSVPLPNERMALLVTDSGVARQLAAGVYNERVDECEEALAQARAAGLAPPQADSLRALSAEQLPQLEQALTGAPLRRARHVLTENARVDAFEVALVGGDLDEAGALLAASQRSLREDYEVSVPELDALCELAAACEGVYGSRLTGAGFGGCVLHLVAPECAADAEARIAAGFEQRFGRRPRSWLVRATAGARAFAC